MHDIQWDVISGASLKDLAWKSQRLSNPEGICLARVFCPSVANPLVGLVRLW